MAEMPTETASFELAWKSAVQEDWMVEMVWFELAYPCAYRKSKSERIDDEVRPVWRANL